MCVFVCVYVCVCLCGGVGEFLCACVFAFEGGGVD